MNDHVELRPGAYADSVALLGVSKALQQAPGVATGQVAMGTPLNVDVLIGMGFAVPPAVTPNDLVVAVRLEPHGDLQDALSVVDAALRPPAPTSGGGGEQPRPRTTRAALTSPGGLVLVSVPGANVVPEAMDALDGGCDVMVFSDNVPLEQELALKRVATERDLLVMGPDCGTAAVGGLGLGFANVTPPGPVGIVAASGTGCQQLMVLLAEAGVGVSAALGVGGRDLSAEVGGLSTRTALRRLDADPDTELIVVVSKPPAPEVAEELEAYVASLSTPVELALLGPGRPDLTAAAERVLARRDVRSPSWPVHGLAERRGDGTRLRGLFVGGTLCQEAALVAAAALGDLEAGGHTLTDYGADEFTSGRAHPMIDPTLRLEALEHALADPDTSVVLLDVVLGHGAEPDPARALAPLLSGARVPVVVALVGTADDPQDRDRQVRQLVEAGAEVHLSNASAARRALELLGGTR